MNSLADELLSEPRLKANLLPKLLASLNCSNELVGELLKKLLVYFLAAFERGDLSEVQQDVKSDRAHETFRLWLLRQYKSFLLSALNLLAQGDAQTQLVALAALMECIREEKPGLLNNQLYSATLEVIVRQKGVCPEVLTTLLAKYQGFVDVRYFTLRSLSQIATKHIGNVVAQEYPSSDNEHTIGTQNEGNYVSSRELARNLLDIIAHLTQSKINGNPYPTWCGAVEAGIITAASDADGSRQRRKRTHETLVNPGPFQETHRAKWASAKLQRKALSDAWLSLLRLDLPEDVYKKVLSHLHDWVIPSCFNPLLLSDFLTHSLDQGGIVGMLALNGIFLLVTQHGLEYPNFYQRLYGLINLKVFQAKYRSRFFQLADAFLASSMVPAYSAASFIKKFARLALKASPGGALTALAFVHNILRRHPACMQLLHRPLSEAVPSVYANGTGPSEHIQYPVSDGIDVFDADELDPALSRGIESSLWEIDALKRHGNPMVANFCDLLFKDLSNRRATAEVDVVDFISKSYASMFGFEIDRRLKSVPSAFYAKSPRRLFDVNSGIDFTLWS